MAVLTLDRQEQGARGQRWVLTDWASRTNHPAENSKGCPGLRCAWSPAYKASQMTGNLQARKRRPTGRWETRFHLLSREPLRKTSGHV